MFIILDCAKEFCDIDTAYPFTDEVSEDPFLVNIADELIGVTYKRGKKLVKMRNERGEEMTPNED